MYRKPRSLRSVRRETFIALVKHAGDLTKAEREAVMQHRIDETSAVYRHATAARQAMRNLAAGAPNSLDAVLGNVVVDDDTDDNKKEKKKEEKEKEKEKENANSDDDDDGNNEKNKKNNSGKKKNSVAVDIDIDVDVDASVERRQRAQPNKRRPPSTGKTKRPTATTSGKKQSDRDAAARARRIAEQALKDNPTS
jgi:hypothetical protein